MKKVTRDFIRGEGNYVPNYEKGQEDQAEVLR
jgi:hypothetical protein